MRQSSIRPGELNTKSLTLAFAVLSVVFVAVLASAPLRPYFAEWRDVQKRYNRLAREAGEPVIPIAIQQIWKPEIGVADRCVTCHLGMGTAAPISSDRLFRAHPPIPHEPSEFGCTVCHGGQGRATTREAAHGFVSHWDEELLEAGHTSAGCGTCHTEFPAALRRELARGLHLFESLDCMSCHRVDGRGRGSDPDLTFAGLRGYRSDWHAFHMEERARHAAGPWRESYGDIAAGDLASLDSFLRTRVGAPLIVEAQALALERGCLGCHKIGGRGGDEAPALDAAGRKPVGDLDFRGVRGEHTFANFLRQHLMDPPGIVPGSLMPPVAMSEDEANLLTSYVLFLRGRDFPASFLPRERVRRELLGEKAPRPTGEQSYIAYCSGCHGPAGEGRNYGNLDVRFPAIGHADFLDVASNEFVERTLQLGRPGRRMPALAGPGGSIDDDEMNAIVEYMRTLARRPPAFYAVQLAVSDAGLGARLYRADCVTCHGGSGEGGPLGPPLATADSRVHDRLATYRATAYGVPGTAMPGYSIYDARALRSLLDHMANFTRAAGSRERWVMGSGNAEAGRTLYDRNCAGCHGSGGEGATGPALKNSGFLEAATPGYIAATIVRGRSGTTMPAFGRDNPSYPRLTSVEVLDVTAFVAAGLE
jgi:mono/diheme cytochrome c family protein